MARVAVIGAGGIGGVLAATAADAGHEVSVAVRTPIAALTVRTGDHERTADVTILGDPAEATPQDWVLLATKSQDTASAAPWLGTLVGPDTVVALAQNGIDLASRVAGLVPPAAAVLPISVVLGAESLGSGHVVHHGYGRLTVPAGDAGRALGALFGDAIEVVITDDFHTVSWRKLLSNAVANPITALTDRRAAVLCEPASEVLVRGLADEVVAVARADGADLTEADVTDLMAHYDGMPPTLGTSMLYDRRSGRTLEHEYLTGAVVAAGERHGIATPMNTAVLALLRGLCVPREGADGS